MASRTRELGKLVDELQAIISRLDTIALLLNPVDVSDRWGRQLGQVDIARVLTAVLSPANPVIAGIYDAVGNRMPSMDAVARAGYVDVIDRAIRLVGIVYGSQGQLAQRPASLDAFVQLRTGGVEYDARQIRALTALDVVTAEQATRTDLKVQDEREDLSPYSQDVAAVGAGDTQLLAGVPGQQHKVYACGYQSDAAVRVGFRFGAGAVWCRRSTAGPYGFSFQNPMIGAVNTALNFNVTGAVNAYVWIQYITE